MIEEQTQQKQLVTQTQAAKILGVKRMTIHRWVKKGKLIPSARVVGGTPLFEMEYLDTFKQERANMNAA